MRHYNAVDMEALQEDDVMLTRLEAIDIVAQHGATLDWFASDSTAPTPTESGYSAFEVFSWLGY